MRCYNGCPDSELKALWDHKADLKRRAREAGVLLTWFPVEERWSAGDLDHGCVPLGDFHRTIDGAFKQGMELKK